MFKASQKASQRECAVSLTDDDKKHCRKGKTEQAVVQIGLGAGSGGDVRVVKLLAPHAGHDFCRLTDAFVQGGQPG